MFTCNSRGINFLCFSRFDGASEGTQGTAHSKATLHCWATSWSSVPCFYLLNMTTKEVLFPFSRFSNMVMTFWMLRNLHTVLTSSTSLSVVTIKHSGQKQPEGGKDLFGLHFQDTEPVAEGSHGRNAKAHPLHSEAHPLPQPQLAQDHAPRDGVWCLVLPTVGSALICPLTTKALMCPLTTKTVSHRRTHRPI